MNVANTYSITIYSSSIYPGQLATKINQDQLLDSKCNKGTNSTRLNSPGLRDTQSNEIATQGISQPGLTPWV